MKNLKKIGAIALSLVLCGVLAACGGSQDEPQESPEDILKGAADYVWGMYKDGGSKTDTFNVVKVCNYDNHKVNVSWELNVTEGITEGAIELQDSGDERFQKVYVGYYDGKVTTKTTYTLKPTFTYEGITKTGAELLGKEEKGIFSFETPVFELHNRTIWDAWDATEDANKVYNIKGRVLDVVATGSSSGSFYFQDAEGYGYYAYSPATKDEIKAGDVVVVTGTRTLYNGQQEYNKGCTFHIYEGATQELKVWDATDSFKAAASNKAFDQKYQNNLVELHNCKPQAYGGSGAYYYFTCDGGAAQYNVYDNTYFLSADQITAWKTAWNDAVNSGATFTIKGIATVYSNAIQIYPTSNFAEVFYDAQAMSEDEKFAAVKDAIAEVFAAKLYDGELTFALPEYATVTFAVTAPETGATIALSEGKLVVAQSGAEVENTIKATIKIGETTREETFTATTALKKTFAPEVGQSYLMYLVQKKKDNTIYYLAGGMNGNYLATTAKMSEAKLVTIEDAGDGKFYLTYLDGEAKKYIDIANATAYIQIKDSEPEAKWSWNDKWATFTTTTAKSGKEVVYLGTYNTFDTFSCSALSYITDENFDVSQFPCHFQVPVVNELSIAEIVDTKVKDDEVTVAGRIIAKDGSGRPVIQDASGTLLIYDNKASLPNGKTLGDVAIGAYIKVKGKYSPYNSFAEIGNSNLQVLEYVEDDAPIVLNEITEKSIEELVAMCDFAGKDVTALNCKIFKVTGVTLMPTQYVNGEYGEEHNPVQIDWSTELKAELGWSYADNQWTGVAEGDQYTMVCVSNGYSGTKLKLIVISAEKVVTPA